MVFEEILKENIGNVIQLIIAFIMLSSVLLSYWMIKKTASDNQSRMFIQLCKEDRIIRKWFIEEKRKVQDIKNKKKQEYLFGPIETYFFDFYEHLAIMFYNHKIDDESFYSYFEGTILIPYLHFIESTLFSGSEDRYDMYPYFSQLLNSFGLSIREIPVELKELRE